KIPVLLVEAIDVANETFPEQYYRSAFDLITKDLYRDNNCEVFILNFHKGGQDIRLNADVVSRALDAIHAVSPTYQVVVVGLSMGGVITRYALAKTEAQGGDHHVGLFISYDSPQGRLGGANVNPDLQDKLFLQDSTIAAIAALQHVFQSDAAK